MEDAREKRIYNLAKDPGETTNVISSIRSGRASRRQADDHRPQRRSSLAQFRKRHTAVERIDLDALI